MNRRSLSTTFSRFVLRSGIVLALLVLPLLAVTRPGDAWSDGAPASLVLGQPDYTSRVAATTPSGMHYPVAVAVDPTTGAVFVADQGNNRVLRFASLAALSNGASADGVLGQHDFTDNAQAAATQSGMNQPQGVAVDSAGRLWVADEGNSRVLRFDNAASKANGAPADGVLGQPDFTRWWTDAMSVMKTPSGVAVDSAGRLWVTDGVNSRVLRFDNAASKPNGAPPDGGLGQTDMQVPSQWGMSVPIDVAVDPTTGAAFVADTYNNRVLRFDNPVSKTNGSPADGVLGQPTFTSRTLATSQSGMNGPTGVAVDSAGRLWVVDLGNHRVLRFDNAASKANGANADGVLGQPDFTSEAAATTQSGMVNPFLVEVDSAGRLWVADCGNNRVLLFQDLAQDAVTVQITRAGASPTRAASLAFLVRFDGPVSGLAVSNFSLATSGTISGASVTQVDRVNASLYTVTVNSGIGDGTLRLDLANATGLAPATVLPSLPFTGGEAYTIDKTAVAPAIDTPAMNSLTANVRPVISGRAGAAEAGATVTVKEGSDTLCTATASADGRWNCTPGWDLVKSVHILSVTQADLAGNISPARTRTFTVGFPFFLPAIRH